MVTYAYYPDKPKSIRCGEDWKWSQKIQDGVWNHIRMWSKLNTPGEEDGEFKAWLNGDEVLYRTGIRYPLLCGLRTYHDALHCTTHMPISGTSRHTQLLSDIP